MNPVFYLIAGPNGAGKTVFTKVYFQGEVIRPDDLVKTPHYQLTETLTLQAVVDKKMSDALQSGRSFAFEHNLHTATILSRVEKAKTAGYQTMLIYLAVEKVEMCIKRVQSRFEAGQRAKRGENIDTLFTGHIVEEAEIRRRYRDSLSTLKTNMKAFDQGVILDNTNPLQRPIPILTFTQGLLLRKKKHLPG